MTDFSPLFTYLDEKFKHIDQQFLEQKQSSDSLQTSVDGLAVIFKKYYEEQKIMTHRLDRVEDWIKKVSAKLGVNFDV
ncbi:MAG: hypothetical protein Q7R60_00285 [bacterium]|nr:hypothetical protein [bacterium]